MNRNDPSQLWRIRDIIRLIRRWTPILMLHEVLPDGPGPLPPFAISRSNLRRILQDFTARGYGPGTLDDVVYGWDQRPSHAGGQDRQGRTGLPGRRLVLTFDDGTCDFIDHALPVLEELGFTATLFIVAGKVGGKRDWSALPGQPPLAPVPLMDAVMLRQLRDRGFTIGSHTMSHPVLPATGDEQAQEEIARSKQVLADMLGQPVRWFAYPYLAATGQTEELVRLAGYEGACGGANRTHQRYYLNRIDATLYSLPQLRLRCNGLFHITRQLVRQLRYRHTTGTPQAISMRANHAGSG